MLKKISKMNWFYHRNQGRKLQTGLQIMEGREIGGTKDGNSHKLETMTKFRTLS